MRLKIKDFLVSLIYILMFFSALSYMRFAYAEVNAWMILHHVVMLSIIFLSMLYFALSWGDRIKFSKIDFFSVILVVFICYEIIISGINSSLGIKALVDIIPWPLLLIMFAHYSRTNDLPRFFSFFSVCGLTLVILFSFPNIIKHLTYFDGGAIFTTFYCFAFLPMLFLTCSKSVAKVFNVIVTVIMLFTLKRSAFLIITVGLALYYFMLNYIERGKGKNIRKYLLFIFALIIFFAFIFFMINSFNLNILSRLENSLNDSGSGRLLIWSQVITNFMGSSFNQKLFGHGFHAVYYKVKPLGIERFAHNSFIETLYDYGAIGLFILLCIVVILVVKAIKMMRSNFKLTPVMFFTLVPTFVLGLLSYFFEESSIIIPISAAWGICIGKFSREKTIDV